MLLEKEKKYHGQIDNAAEEISIVKKEYSSLKCIADKAREYVAALEIEKDRQITFLEKENLQLLEELNMKKKEIHKLIAERDVQRCTNDDDKSEELGELYSAYNENQKNKENKINSQENRTISLKDCGTRNRNDSVLSDKKNRLNISETSLSHTSSFSKSNYKGLGSGEGEATDENTTECNTN